VETPLGVGWGNAAFALYKDGMPFIDKHMHNITAQFALELGWPGLVWCVVFAFLAIRAVKWTPFAFAFLGVQAIHSMLEYPMWYAYLLGPTAFIFGLACAKQSER
jgi:O-antigen ligase